jgi:hypothetical protein
MSIDTHTRIVKGCRFIVNFNGEWDSKLVDIALKGLYQYLKSELDYRETVRGEIKVKEKDA